MNTLDELRLLLTGTAVRLVLPVCLTLAAAWLLRQLDARWQAEAAASTRRRPSSPRTACWAVRNCSVEQRERCLAYGQTSVPCWQYFRDPRGNLRADCLTCEVLRDAPVAVLA